ncbi:MAG: Ig-like domain-containing protein, partial [Lachnospiraceae bacterium]|nr:Ig-like domain-containing protein [Lachnospiraceae bacterium]
ITKPELTNKKLKLEAGVAGKDTGSVALKNVDNIDVYYYSASPDVALVDQDGNVTAVGKGSAKITAYANGTAYTATVSVKEPSAVKERTLHLSTDGSKSVKLSGVKKTVWDYAEGTTEEEKAIVSLKGAKITGKKAGIVTLVAKDAMTSYIMTVKVDDPAIILLHEEDKYDLAKNKGNKYTLTIAAGQKITLSYADVDQPVIYKSSKPEIAFIDENGNIEARGKGKAKFTAKVNGKAITISVNVK